MGPHELPEGFVEQWMRKYEDKVYALEELRAQEIIAERKRSVSVFSDEQNHRIDEIIAKALLALLGSDAFSDRVTKQVKFLLGEQAVRFLLYLAGAFIAGGLSVYFGFRH